MPDIEKIRAEIEREIEVAVGAGNAYASQAADAQYQVLLANAREECAVQRAEAFSGLLRMLAEEVKDDGGH